jgi:hypothetical protein
MRRTVWIVSLAGALALAAVVLFKPRSSPAEDAAAAGEKPDARVAPHLPVTHVTLYSSGVGYFQREGEVEGDARVDLAFPVQDVNDLLKSMVLEDRSGGTVSAASYDSQDPMDKALGSFAVNLASNPSFAELLQQARGEKVEVLLNKGAAPLAGTIIGIEPGFKELLYSNGQWGAPKPGAAPTAMTASAARSSPVVAYYQRAGNAPPALTPEGPLEAALTAYAREPARLNLWCAEGLRSIPLTEVQRVRFVNPAMDREVRRALEVLAGAHDTQKRAVSLRFSGEGKRKVRVGYVVESPLWRTSYRLLIREGGKLYLQGWAVVENPTSEDWKDVRLALVSGCPISFKMDLSQPLYRQRPTVQPEVYGVVPPTTHAAPVNPVADLVVPRNAGPVVAPMPAAMPAWQAPASPPVPRGGLSGVAVGGQLGNSPQQINPQNGVSAAATGAELGDFFQYEIKHAVSLPRQKSAMLPIVSKAIEGNRVSLYNPATHAKYPLLALRVKNTSGVHLMQGPVAIFEGTGYAGDAHLLDLRPGEDRLISYAVDLGTEVEPQAASSTAKLTSIKIEKGQLVTTSKARQAKTYTARNRSKHDRTVLIEHPYTPEYKLVSKSKPVEKTHELLRFELKVPAGKSAALEVVEEWDVTGQMALSGCVEQQLRAFLKGVKSSDEVKQAVEKALALRGKLTATQQKLGRMQGELQAIAKDQERLRANLKEMPASAAAYKRYLAKFDKQETEIEKLQADVRELQDVEARQRQEYEAYWGQVDIGPTPASAAGEASSIWEGVPPTPVSPTARGVAPAPASVP